MFGLIYKVKYVLSNEIIEIKTIFLELRFKIRESSILSELNNINIIKLWNHFYTNKDNNSKNKCLNISENLNHFIYFNSYLS